MNLTPEEKQRTIFIGKKLFIYFNNKMFKNYSKRWPQHENHLNDVGKNITW